MSGMLTSETLSDEEVVDRVRRGETALFELILRRHNQRLFRVARAVLKDDVEAEDALQQAWLAAYAHLDQFAGAAQLSTWLTRIALHAALARRRQRLRRSEVVFADGDDAMDEGRPRPSTPEQEAHAREMATLVERAVDELPEIYRLVFVLREVQEMSTAEAAACLEVTEEVVKTRLLRARAMLREAIATRADAAAPDAFRFLGARCDRMVARVMAELAPKLQ